MITAANPLSISTTALTLDEAPRYTIEVESYSSEFAVLRISGDLDLTARAALVNTLDRLLDGGTDVLVDLSAVAFIYSGAANAIVDAASSSDADVRIFAPTRPVRMILDVLGAGDLLVDSPIDSRISA